MTYSTIIYEKEDGLAIITFNRPEKRNALNPQLTSEIDSALTDAENDNDVYAVILTGGTKSFISGTDMDFRSGPTGMVMEISGVRQGPEKIDRPSQGRPGRPDRGQTYE